MTTGMLDLSCLAQIIVLRILCSGENGCTNAEVTNDLQQYTSHRLSMGEWRSTLESILENLQQKKAISQTDKGKITCLEKGEKEALEFLGIEKLPTHDWKDLKAIYLSAKALGLKSRSSKTLKPLKTAEGLRAAIVKTYFNLLIKAEIPSISQIRNALAIDTIGETFKAPKENAISTNSRVPEKLALFLASKKLNRPRDVDSSSQLLSLLAAEAIGSVQSDPNALRLTLLRKLITKQEHSTHQLGANKDMEKKDKKLNLEDFSGIVHKLAESHAKGWTGNRRAYISHVWNSLKKEKPNLKLDEDAFKSMLTEAHRAGHITLAIADLRDKANITDIQNSVTRYKNTEWHLIRVED